MKKLVSSSEAAKLLGLSLQGIHYRIKKGQLESVKKDGKIFVYVDTKSNNARIIPITPTFDGTALALKSKDEQISLLKKTIKYLKKQHDKEIIRVQQNQDKILSVFQSEVDLLKSAFNEMKNIYQIEQKQSKNITLSDLSSFKKNYNIKKDKYISVTKFYALMKKQNKTEHEIKRIIIDKIKSDDVRFIYDHTINKIKILNVDYNDIL